MQNAGIAEIYKLLLLILAPYDTGKTYRFAVPLIRDKEVSLTLITARKK